MLNRWLALQCCDAEPKGLLAIGETEPQNSSAGVWYNFQRCLHQNIERTCSSRQNTKQLNRSSENSVHHLRLNNKSNRYHHDENQLRHNRPHGRKCLAIEIWRAKLGCRLKMDHFLPATVCFGLLLKAISACQHACKITRIANLLRRVFLRLLLLLFGLKNGSWRFGRPRYKSLRHWNV